MSDTKKPGKGFQFFRGDVNWLDYGGTWARRIDGKRYHFIELINMDEACGRDNEGQPRYTVELCEVDLAVVPPREMRSALQFCDMLEWASEHLDGGADM